MMTSAFAYLLLRAPLFPMLRGPRRERPVGPARAAARDEVRKPLMLNAETGEKSWLEGHLKRRTRRSFVRIGYREKNVPR
ncbi:hypothetical protein WN51_06401 [Melipona quadrifasciata]|uniref:Uncharacterized protein n=1 Tax=Melipona quadrifasciata TaxID=166423 RepID=A0A0M9ABX0_9HYME|nr:hypothetical protein WN51_06401 [Melipona quadrifasciata]